MIGVAQYRSLAIAWLLLLGATIVGFWAAELLHPRIAAISVIMLIAAFKVRVILYRFMELEDTSKPFRVFMNIWLFAVALMITGLYIAAPH